MRPGRSRSKFGRSSSDLTAEGKVLIAAAVFVAADALGFRAADFDLVVVRVVFLRVVAIVCSGYQERRSDSNQES